MHNDAALLIDRPVTECEVIDSTFRGCLEDDSVQLSDPLTLDASDPLEWLFTSSST